MRGWLWMLSGLLIWAAHFGVLYAAASVDAQTPVDDRGLWRAVVIAATLVGLAGSGAVLARSRRRAAALPDRLAALGSVGGAVAITWQAIAALLG